MAAVTQRLAAVVMLTMAPSTAARIKLRKVSRISANCIAGDYVLLL
jgi:hypothetical protein